MSKLIPSFILCKSLSSSKDSFMTNIYFHVRRHSGQCGVSVASSSPFHAQPLTNGRQLYDDGIFHKNIIICTALVHTMSQSTSHPPYDVLRKVE